MGVPFLFSAINEYFSFAKKNIDPHYDTILIDSNYIIHLVVSEYEWNNYCDILIIDKFIKYLDQILNTIQHTNYGIFFDGCTPYSKFIRQRSSRLFYNIFEFNGNDWDQNKITYGSPFMNELIEKTYKYFNKSIIKTIDNGEAEMSIIKYYKLYSGNTLIISPDTDFITLGLMHLNNTFNLDILFERNKAKYIYNINKIYSYIEKENIDDFIFAMSFIGNDFILPLHDFKFKFKNKKTDLFNNIKNAIQKYEGNIIENGGINVANLSIFIKNIPIICKKYNTYYLNYIDKNQTNIIEEYLNNLIMVNTYYKTTNAIKFIYNYNFIPYRDAILNYLDNYNKKIYTFNIVWDSFPTTGKLRYEQMMTFIKRNQHAFKTDKYGKYVYYWDFEIPRYARRPILI